MEIGYIVRRAALEQTAVSEYCDRGKRGREVFIKFRLFVLSDGTEDLADDYKVSAAVTCRDYKLAVFLGPFGNVSFDSRSSGLFHSL